MNLLLTGFGPFPGARFNPTGPLVQKLAGSRKLPGVHRTAHVFRTSYAAVDREFPLLLQREQPDVLVMFGLAARTRHLRIETQARNAASLLHPDAAGTLPGTDTIAAGAAALLPMRTPAQRLLAAARSTGVDVRLSRDAGRYLCNYLCWRATEAVAQRGPKIAAFVHVPKVRGPGSPTGLPFLDLLRASEAMVRAAVAAARTMR